MKTQIFTLLMTFYFPVLIFAQWNNDPSQNTLIIERMGSEVQPKIVVNNSGQSYISWFWKNGDTPFTVYMQRLDADGTYLWADTGILISNHETKTWTSDYGLALDNEDNAILVTQDIRTGNSDVYAYKISPTGELLWGDDGVALTNDVAANYSPKVVSDNNGNNIFMWDNETVSDYLFISFQKLSADGQALWNDVRISEDTMHCWQPSMIKSGDNDIIAVWIETATMDTTIGNWPDMFIYAQKIDGDGNFMWDENVPLDTLENNPLGKFKPSLQSDGNGGLFVSWPAYQPSGMTGSYVQHITADGETQWDANGLAVSDSLQFYHFSPKVFHLEENNGVFVFWVETREYGESTVKGAVFGQKISEQGELLWSAQGIQFSDWINVPDTLFDVLDVKQATANDFTVFYQYQYVDYIYQDTLFHSLLYATRIDENGDFVWGNERIEFATFNSDKHDFAASEQVNGQWICVWEDNRNDPTHTILSDIYAQNITLDGYMGPLGTHDRTVEKASILTVFPNPSANQINIEYSLKTKGDVQIDVLDVNEKYISRLFEGQQMPGIHSAQFNVAGLKTGVYLLRLQIANTYAYGKLIKK